MNLVADKIYVGKFDHARGTGHIEHDIRQGKDVPEVHLRACRMGREEIVRTWLKCVQQLVQQFFITTGTVVDDKRLFQYQLPEACWNNLPGIVRAVGESAHSGWSVRIRGFPLGPVLVVPGKQYL